MCTKLPQDALEERLRWVLPIVNKEIRLNEAVKVFAGSQRTLERWVSAYRRDGEAGLSPKSTRPKSHPQETPIRIKERVIELRKKTRLCAKKLNYKLAKEGIGIEDILERIIRVVPAPAGDDDHPLQALVFDSNFDIYKGVIVYVRVKNGKIAPGATLRMMQAGKNYDLEEIGVFKPEPIRIDGLSCGEVGYITCSVHDPQQIKIGDTVIIE